MAGMIFRLTRFKKFNGFNHSAKQSTIDRTKQSNLPLSTSGGITGLQNSRKVNQTQIFSEFF